MPEIINFLQKSGNIAHNISKNALNYLTLFQRHSSRINAPLCRKKIGFLPTKTLATAKQPSEYLFFRKSSTFSFFQNFTKSSVSFCQSLLYTIKQQTNWRCFKDIYGAQVRIYAENTALPTAEILQKSSRNIHFAGFKPNKCASAQNPVKKCPF